MSVPFDFFFWRFDQIADDAEQDAEGKNDYAGGAEAGFLAIVGE